MPDLVPPCPCCGATVPVHHPRLEHLRLYDWGLFREATVANHCGHRQDYLLLPTRDGVMARLVPILGEAL